MKIKINVRKISVFIYSLSIYCNAYLCFTWSSFNPTLAKILLLVSYLGPVFLVAYALFFKQIRNIKSYKPLIVIVVFLYLMFHLNFMGKYYVSFFSISDIRLIICAIVLILVDNKLRKEIYDALMKMFAIATLPSIVYFLLGNIDLDLPHSRLMPMHSQKVLRGVYYKHYPFGLVITSPFMSPRPTGVFDEPGVIGTLAAFFFAGNSQRHKKWSILLIIEGIFSLSMAFYLLVVIYYICKYSLKRSFKVVVFLSALLIAVNLFVNLDIDNESIKKFQSRFDVTSGISIEDDRTTDIFDNEFNMFIKKADYSTFMGTGKYAYRHNAAMQTSYSYKLFIYDHGLWGFFVYILFFACVCWLLGMNKQTLPFLAVFLASIYQRPYVLDIEYFTIFICAVSSLIEKEESLLQEKIFSNKRVQQLGRRLSIS